MCPTITVGSFFFKTRKVHFLFICSTTSTTSNLNNSNLRSVQNEKQKQNRRPQPRNHTKDPHFFSELCDFLKLFGLKFFPQRVPPSIFLMFCNTMDVKKSQRVPLFTFFGTVTLFKNLNKKFFGNFFMSPKGPPFNFFKIFCNQLEFHKARRVLRISESQLVFFSYFHF